MPRATATSLQDDIVGAFSVTTNKIFYRQNKQIYAIVGANPNLHIVSEVWFGEFDTQEEFRAVLQHIFGLFGDEGYRYWLADLRFLKSDFSPSINWLTTQLMPAMFNAGLAREAVVLPDHAVNEEGEDVYASASGVLKTLTDGRVRGFTNVQHAKQWLLDGILP